MEAQCKVIPLNTAMTAAYDILARDADAEPIGTGEETNLINKALCVVREMEQEWETDHAAPGIRDKIHLIAYYLGRLTRP